MNLVTVAHTLILALKTLSQVDLCEFKISLVYTANLRKARAYI